MKKKRPISPAPQSPQNQPAQGAVLRIAVATGARLAATAAVTAIFALKTYSAAPHETAGRTALIAAPGIASSGAKAGQSTYEPYFTEQP